MQRPPAAPVLLIVLVFYFWVRILEAIIHKIAKYVFCSVIFVFFLQSLYITYNVWQDGKHFSPNKCIILGHHIFKIVQDSNVNDHDFLNISSILWFYMYLYYCIIYIYFLFLTNYNTIITFNKLEDNRKKSLE